MRTKEDSHDYRYFPEPDLPPLVIPEDRVTPHREGMPELPRQKYLRFIESFGIPRDDARMLISDKQLGTFFEAAADASKNPKAVANWIMGDFMRDIKNLENGLDDCPISPAHLAELVNAIEDKIISGKIAKEVFVDMFQTGKMPAQIIDEKGLKQITDTGELEQVVVQTIESFPDQLAQYRAGKTKVLGFFVGQIMKATRGKGNPAIVNQLLKK